MVRHELPQLKATWYMPQISQHVRADTTATFVSQQRFGPLQTTWQRCILRRARMVRRKKDMRVSTHALLCRLKAYMVICIFFHCSDTHLLLCHYDQTRPHAVPAKARTSRQTTLPDTHLLMCHQQTACPDRHRSHYKLHDDPTNTATTTGTTRHGYPPNARYNDCKLHVPARIHYQTTCVYVPTRTAVPLQTAWSDKNQYKTLHVCMCMFRHALLLCHYVQTTCSNTHSL